VEQIWPAVCRRGVDQSQSKKSDQVAAALTAHGSRRDGLQASGERQMSDGKVSCRSWRDHRGASHRLGR
jgi:hypothetical protein